MSAAVSCLSALLNALPAFLFLGTSLSRAGRDGFCISEQQIQCILQCLLLGVGIVALRAAGVDVIPQLLQVAATQYEGLTHAFRPHNSSSNAR